MGIIINKRHTSSSSLRNDQLTTRDCVFLVYHLNFQNYSLQQLVITINHLLIAVNPLFIHGSCYSTRAGFKLGHCIT